MLRKLAVYGFSLLFLLLASNSWAHIQHFSVWSPFDDEGPKLLLPVTEGSTAAQMACRYLAALQAAPATAWGYMPVALSFNFATSPEAFLAVNQRSLHGEPSGEPRMAIVANRLGHMHCDDAFPFVRQQLASYGAAVHVIPLGLDLVLNPAELKELQSFIVSHYHGLVAIGGGDIHPSLYGQVPTCNDSLYLGIDRLELALLQEWFFHGRGPLFGICRGHQLISVMLGCSLVQDLGMDCPQPIDHSGFGMSGVGMSGVGMSGSALATSNSNCWHPVVVLPGDQSLRRATGKASFMVNSRHHQALLRQQASSLVAASIAAMTGEVVEALQLHNDRGFSVQFHPEDMNSCEGQGIMEEMVGQARRYSQQNHSPV